MKPVLLINPNSSVQTTAAMLAIARRHLPDVEGWTNAKAPGMITDPAALSAAGDQIVTAALPSAQGIIIAAFGDPGAEHLAAINDVPVVGIGAAAARQAGRGEDRFAVVTTTPRLAPAIDVLMRAHGKNYLGCFLTDGAPEALLADPVRLDAALIAGCIRACDAGAARVIIGGGPLATAAERIAPAVPVPLVQPLVAACKEIAAATTGHPVPPAPDGSQSAR
ncbi:MAG: aspartate/glutamate racemase family protein [Roseobacter sp.]